MDEVQKQIYTLFTPCGALSIEYSDNGTEVMGSELVIDFLKSLIDGCIYVEDGHAIVYPPSADNLVWLEGLGGIVVSDDTIDLDFGGTE